MTLENTVLAKLTEWHPEGGRQQLLIPDAGAGWTVTLTADRCDELGCLLWEMTLRRTAATPAGVDLRGWAARATRTSGLLEQLKVLEVDDQRQEVLLRSATPTVRGEKRGYYEAVLKNTTEATFRRFQTAAAAAEPRHQVAFALTHEVLARLAADLSADS